MKKLLGLLLACLVSFSAAAQTKPVHRSQADKDLEYAALSIDVNRVQTALDQGANPRAIGVYYDVCHDILRSMIYYRVNWHDYEHKDQVMQIVRLLIQNGADMTEHACGESALEEALNKVSSYGCYRCDAEGYEYAFDVLDLMLSLTDSSKALATVHPGVIESVISGAGFKHPELFRYLIDKGLKVQPQYIEVARQRVEDELESGPDVGGRKEVADLLQQAYEEQSTELIKALIKRDLQIREQFPALRK